MSGRRPSRRVPARQQASDVQILLMWNDPDEAGNYTGKLFEYLGSGRPILMMGYRARRRSRAHP